jgi:hypothetical protein
MLLVTIAVAIAGFTIAGHLAVTKGRSYLGWGLVGAVIPLFGVIIAASLTPAEVLAARARLRVRG